MESTVKLKYLGGAVVAGVAGWWLSLHVAIQILIMLQLGDVVSGFLASVVLRNTSSSIAWRSITAKKAMVWVVVFTGIKLSALAPELRAEVAGHSLTPGVSFAVAYCWVEVISILENAGKAGALPGPVLEVVRKFVPGANPPVKE